MAKVPQLKIELGQEDGRWIGEVPTLPGVMAYGRRRLQRLRLFKPWPFEPWPIASNMTRRCLMSY